MATITGARAYVNVPAPAPKLGGALSVVRVVNVSGHELLGAEYETDSCFTVEEWLSNCGNYPTAADCNTNPTIAEKKVFNGPEMVEGDPFALYSGIACSSLSALTQQDGQRAQASLELKEGRGVEEHLTGLFAAFPGKVSLSGGSVAEAIGALEGWLETEYAGQGYIGMSREVAVAAAAAHIVARNLDGTLSTIIGTPIMLGVGDPDTLFASGQVTLLRGPVILNTAPQMDLPDGTCLPARALAERTYVPLVECGVAQADISTPVP